MSTVRNLICIGCPMGCPLEVQMEDGQVISVTGNTCKRGEDYGKKECTNPTRIVTSSVVVEDGQLDTLSVKTEKDIPKNKIFECIQNLRGVVVKAPVKVGEIIVKNIANTGVNIIATKNILAK
jgi:CxxC motif-containing protein